GRARARPREPRWRETRTRETRTRDAGSRMVRWWTAWRTPWSVRMSARLELGGRRGGIYACPPTPRDALRRRARSREGTCPRAGSAGRARGEGLLRQDLYMLYRSCRKRPLLVLQRSEPSAD